MVNLELLLQLMVTLFNDTTIKCLHIRPRYDITHKLLDILEEKERRRERERTCKPYQVPATYMALNKIRSFSEPLFHVYDGDKTSVSGDYRKV